MKRIRASLTAKIFAITMLLLALACAVTYGVIALSLPVSYDITVTAQLQEDVDSLVEKLADIEMEDSASILNTFQMQTGAQVTVLDEAGNRIYINGFSTDADLAEDTQSASATMADAEDSVVIESYTIYTDDTQYAYSVETEQAVETVLVGQEVYCTGDTQSYALVVTPGMRTVNQAEQALRQMLPVLAVSILLVSLLGAAAISTYVTRPIVRLSGISKRLSALDFTWTYETHRTDEIGVLAQSLHTLSARLSQALESLRGEVAREKELQLRRSEFFSAVSHELKTPLTVIQGQLEGMIDGVGVYADRDTYLARTLDTAHQMSGMVQDILQVFRMEQEQFALQLEWLDLAALVKETAEAYGPLFEQHGVALAVRADGPAMVQGDARLLRQAVGNLLDNAAQYSPDGAEAAVRVWPADGVAHIEVENTGAHIPEDVRSHLFEAFYRGESSRSRATGGTGLGLHLVAGVLKRHGAAYAIENTAGGVRVRIDLPQNHTQST